VTGVLITGLSGVGKSTVIAGLQGRGQTAVDLDNTEWSEWASTTTDDGVRGHQDWLWREDRVSRLLDAHMDAVLFVSGCASNQVRFYPRFDHIVLLSAPAELMASRLCTRTTNPYGREPAELERALALKQTIEPLLRKEATLELDTSAPLDQVIAAILALVA
jgi:broad-specificity NMP kinase